MSPISPSGAAYPSNPLFNPPYEYEDPIDPQIPRGYSGEYGRDSHIALQQHAPPAGPPQGQSTSPGEPKSRLRKACDSCSVRKVKCDENGPPCKSCAALDIPCTFERPSRRRGPPNRHAEAIKRQKLEDGSYNASTGSPTYDAAYSLAALSAPAPLSAESICDFRTLEILIDDYFYYIHPVVPLPHEPTFRAAFARREDKTDRGFLAMIAVMLETLVASFPRRPRQLFASEPARRQFPNAGALIDRCHQVFNEARGIGYLDRTPTLYDAFSSYLAGLASAYVMDARRMIHYFGECVMSLRYLGFHRVDIPIPQASQESPADPQHPITDYIYQESGRRLFWLVFVGAMSMRQLEELEYEILMPPSLHAERLPPLPLEVDDDFITESTVFPQPPGTVSIITGFNLNIKVFKAFHGLTAMEMAFGVDTVYDWDKQRQMIRRALANVKAATIDAPQELQLNPVNDFGSWPPTSYDVSAYASQYAPQPDQNIDTNLPSVDSNRQGLNNPPFPRRTVQCEIQKANIYATQLATRSYLVERFWNLYEIYDESKTSPTSVPSQMHGASRSPTIGALMSVAENYPGSTGQTSSDSQMDAGEQFMAVERENIVRDLAVLLRSINQVNMEPNGQSFCHKIRQVASTLLETKRARMSVMPTLDSDSVNQYLYVFLEILAKLERLGPGLIRATAGNAYAGNRTAEDIEEEELVHWASLKEHQERFVRSEQFLQ